MNTLQKVSVVLIPREKYSASAVSLGTILDYCPSNSEIIVVNNGYPEHRLEELKILGQKRTDITFAIIEVAPYSSTNVIWNLLASVLTGDILVLIENDIEIENNTITHSIEALDYGFCRISVPVVIEEDNKTIHFCPSISEINQLENGEIEININRGRRDNEVVKGFRLINHLERHCLIMRKETFTDIGKLDEEMFCRTDVDMSILCRLKNISVGLIDSTRVYYHSSISSEDIEFYDHRWNVDRVTESHSRLLTKWKLRGYKKTAEHVFEMREKLTNLKNV